MAVDPVCRKEVGAAKTSRYTEHHGLKYYFCSKSCQKTFLANPEHFIRRDSKSSLNKKTGISQSASCDFTAV